MVPVFVVEYCFLFSLSFDGHKRLFLAITTDPRKEWAAAVVKDPTCLGEKKMAFYIHGI